MNSKFIENCDGVSIRESENVPLKGKSLRGVNRKEKGFIFQSTFPDASPVPTGSTPTFSTVRWAQRVEGFSPTSMTVQFIWANYYPLPAKGSWIGMLGTPRLNPGL